MVDESYTKLLQELKHNKFFHMYHHLISPWMYDEQQIKSKDALLKMKLLEEQS